MTVYELNRDELNELKSAYYYDPDTQDILPDYVIFPEDIPDDIIYNHYDGIMFVEEDFFCNC